MRDVAGQGAEDGPDRSDLALHELAGGNNFAFDLIDEWYPDETESDVLFAGRTRALHMLSLAAKLELSITGQDSRTELKVKVTNQTGHKLPSGYPEGRRIWLNVRALDRDGVIIYESGAYDPATGTLTRDTAAKIYEIKPGISERLAPVVGQPAGPSFHFVLNDTIYSDNRIPPRGFTNAAFTTIQSPPVAYTYADGQYWDETVYTFPAGAVEAEAVLYYQSTSREYIEFLRDENVTDTVGQDLYDSWAAHGRAAPAIMASERIQLMAANIDQPATAITGLGNDRLSPSNRIRYSLASPGPVQLDIVDAGGRIVRTLVKEERTAGLHLVIWDGFEESGRRAATGVYTCVLRTGDQELRQKMTLIK